MTNTTSTIQEGGFAFQSTIAAGGLSGGITSTMAGGDFWDGVCNGLISAGLNHALHLVGEKLSNPDDPPGENSKTNNAQSAVAVTSGMDSGVNSAVEFSRGIKTNPEFEKIWSKVSTNAKILGIACSLTNFGISIYKAYTGQISWDVFALQTGVTLAEIGLNAIPLAGSILSTSLTAYDAGGGFDNTLYNDNWIKEHSGPMPGYLNVKFGSEYYYRNIDKQVY